MPDPTTIAVIVPVLDESSCIEAQLRRLTATGGFDEVIVVDGGSADDTVRRASAFERVRVLSGARGRALQMNAGAGEATSEVLLFLHADVTLPPEAPDWIRATLSQPGTVAGAFRTWTVPEGASWLGPLLHLADVRSRVAELPYGDQALFVRADAFRRVGGFPELPIMEDLALSRRLRRLGHIARVPATVRVSGRRFQSRPVYYTLLVNVMPTLYRLGVPPRILASLYGQPR